MFFRNESSRFLKTSIFLFFIFSGRTIYAPVDVNRQSIRCAHLRIRGMRKHVLVIVYHAHALKDTISIQNYVNVWKPINRLSVMTSQIRSWYLEVDNLFEINGLLYFTLYSNFNYKVRYHDLFIETYWNKRKIWFIFPWFDFWGLTGCQMSTNIQRGNMTFLDKFKSFKS